MHKVAVTRF